MDISIQKEKYESALITALRFGLALIFVWFGVLKIFGFNPVFDLVHSVTPFLSSGKGLILLGVFETLIGIGLAVNKLRALTHVLLILHLSGTFITFITGIEVVFQPYFPVLSLGGEFVLKNLILAISGLVVLLHGSSAKKSPT